MYLFIGLYLKVAGETVIWEFFWGGGGERDMDEVEGVHPGQGHLPPIQGGIDPPQTDYSWLQFFLW